MTIKDFYDHYIAYGDYQRSLEKSIYTGMYQFPHFLMLSINLIIIFFVLRATKGKTRKQIDHMLKVVAVIMLIVEVLRMIWFSVYRPDTYTIRFDWCNQVCLWMPIFILANRKETYPFFMGAAFYGGAGVNLYPLWIFYDYGGLHLISIQSMLTHGLMLLSSLLMLRSYPVKEIKKDFLVCFIGFSIMCIVAATMAFIRKENYMALIDNSGLPLVSLIPSPWHNFVMLPIEMFSYYFVLVVFKKLQVKYLAKESVEEC